MCILIQFCLYMDCLRDYLQFRIHMGVYVLVVLEYSVCSMYCTVVNGSLRQYTIEHIYSLVSEWSYDHHHDDDPNLGNGNGRMATRNDDDDMSSYYSGSKFVPVGKFQKGKQIQTLLWRCFCCSRGFIELSITLRQSS